MFIHSWKLKSFTYQLRNSPAADITVAQRLFIEMLNYNIIFICFMVN